MLVSILYDFLLHPLKKTIWVNFSNYFLNISTRNIMMELRDSGIVTGGPNTLNQSDHHEFANQLDKIITKWGSLS